MENLAKREMFLWKAQSNKLLTWTAWKGAPDDSDETGIFGASRAGQSTRPALGSNFYGKRWSTSARCGLQQKAAPLEYRE